jgi:hypothetical protein
MYRNLRVVFFAVFDFTHNASVTEWMDFPCGKVWAKSNQDRNIILRAIHESPSSPGVPQISASMSLRSRSTNTMKTQTAVSPAVPRQLHDKLVRIVLELHELPHGLQILFQTQLDPEGKRWFFRIYIFGLLLFNV